MEHGGEASVLDWVCRLTLFIAPALSIPGTYRAWRQRTLGVGGRRPEPTVAALICNLAWVMYGIQVAKHKWEPVSLNAWGALLQLVYLITFLALCTPEERDRVPVPMGYGCVYLCCTFFIGGLHADAFKWFCTAAGCMAATAPLLSIAFLTDEWTFAMLPYWGISAFSVVHGVLWLARGFPMENDPKQTGPNYSMVAQNGLGALCSLLLLLLALCWPYAHVQPTAQDADVRGSITRAEIVEAARTAHNQGVLLAPPQTRHTRRRRAVNHNALQQPVGQQVPEQHQQPAGLQAPPPAQPAGPQPQVPEQQQQPAAVLQAPPPPQPPGPQVPDPEQQQQPAAVLQAPPPPQPAGPQVPDPEQQQQPAVLQAPLPPQPAGPQVPEQQQQPAGLQAPPPPQPVGLQAPPPEQPAIQVRRSLRLQALVQTSGDDEVAPATPATPSTSTSGVSQSHRYMTRQKARATGQTVSIDIPEPIQRGPNHSGHF